MVGLVIAAHGRLAHELVSTAEQIVGALHHVAACSVEPGAAPDDIKASIRQAMKAVEGDEGVIVFADLIGGSPCTQSLSMCQKANIEVLTGVNLPMLLKANTLRGQHLPLPELARALAAYGQKHITCATELLRRSA